MSAAPRRAALISLAVAIGLATQAAPAAAESPWSAELEVASEYMSKGRSRSDGRPHAGLKVERSFGAVYVGGWAGTQTASNGADSQTNIYAGVTVEPASWEVTVDLEYKRRWNTTPGADSDAVELNIGAERSFGDTTLALSLDSTPDNYGSTRQSVWAEAELERAISERWSVVGGIGRREQVASPDYTAWNVGAVVHLTERVDLDVRYFDTDGHEYDDSYDGRAAVSLFVSF